MPTVAEAIDNEVLRRLGNITLANGYSFNATPKKLERDTGDYQPQPWQIVVQETEESRVPELTCVGNPPAVAYAREYQIDGYTKQLNETGQQIETTDRSITEPEMIGAIQKALVDNDSVNWRSFGGNAVNASMDATQSFDAPGYDGGRVLLSILYRFDETDPTQKR